MRQLLVGMGLLLMCATGAIAQDSSPPSSQEIKSSIFNLSDFNFPEISENNQSRDKNLNPEDNRRESWIKSAIIAGYHKKGYQKLLGRHFAYLQLSRNFEIRNPTGFFIRTRVDSNNPSVKYVFIEDWEVPTRRFSQANQLRTTMTFYPFAEFAVIKDTKLGLIESGFRMNVAKLRIEKYRSDFRVDMGTEVLRRYELAPTFFMDIYFGRR